MKKIIIIVLCVLVALTGIGLGQVVNQSTIASVSAYSARLTIEDVIGGITSWKKTDVGAAENEHIINDNFLRFAGTTSGDWFPIGLGRLGIADNQDGYLAVISDNVQKRYNTNDKLHKAKATEWQRIALAVLACGGNPRRMGDNKDIDLIADGTYNRVDGSGNGILGKQGINGFIWGLIALDSRFYEVPKGAYYSRDDIILNIMNKQLADGGWALSGSVSDPDIAAMAIQSLAPYYNSEKEYSYINTNVKANGTIITKKVRTVIDEAVAWLSDVQQPDGGYYSWGMANCESAVQVAVAISSLGIDIFSDIRFIKNEKTIYDGILKYRNKDGGFSHSFVYDEENPSSSPDQSNTMASEQALYGMAAILRMKNNKRRLYDFREESTSTLRMQIANVEQKINNLSSTSTSHSIKSVYDDYLAIFGAERSYVKNYKKLSELLLFAGIEYEKEDIEYNSGDAGIIDVVEEFTAVDIAAVNALPKKVTTAYRERVLKLFEKIKNCFDFDEKQAMYIKLEKAKNEIDLLQLEIDSINTEIMNKLHPFDHIGLGDKKTINEIVARYNMLSEYDKTKITHFEDLLKSKTQVDNLTTALIIGVVCSAVAVGLAVFVMLHIKKRKKVKSEKSMAESED